jgi:beta-glucanase (GH16 family)
MRNFSIATSFLFVLYLTVGCSSKKNDTANLAPTNLVVNATASQDSSGNVSFIATATNATTFYFDFGNGDDQAFNSGTLTYQYSYSGNYSVRVSAKSASGQIISVNTQVTVAKSVKLLWSDEFNTDGAPDPSKWGYDTGTGSGGWGNNELENYTSRSDNSFVKSGYLNIVAKKESYGGSSYTSARMLTKNKFSFKYGRVEIKAMLPAGNGTWPALWMLGSNIDALSWPNCGEIDIMEQRGSELNKIWATLHYPGHSGANGIGATTIIQNSSTQFHVYSLDWSVNSIKIAVDGQVYQSVANDNTLPFNNNFFLIFNVAMGGNFAGSVDSNFSNAAMLVDYIRVYQ